jgi:methylenetetrahydrofolate reductase (NADPH)
VHTLPGALLTDFSLGMHCKDVGELGQAVIPPGSRVHVGFVDSEHIAMRVDAARAIKQSGFEPVAVISARRLRSQAMLLEYLAGLRAADASRSVLVVAGDPAQPLGPYPDATSVINSGALEKYGVRQVSVAGHPTGHPVVTDDELWQALADKVAELEKRSLVASVTTQLGFDAGRMLAWLAQVRARGLRVTVRVGVPGPASTRRLRWYASRCDVSVNAAVAKEYGLSPTDPAGTVGPDRFIRALASGYDTRLHGEVKLHFFTFDGFAATAEWITDFRARQLRGYAADYEGYASDPAARGEHEPAEDELAEHVVPAFDDGYIADVPQQLGDDRLGRVAKAAEHL